jgi:hypothetical protein
MYAFGIWADAEKPGPTKQLLIFRRVMHGSPGVTVRRCTLVGVKRCSNLNLRFIL